MEFLGVGPTELMLIIILALVLVGPRDLAKFGREAGRFLNQLYHSQTWRTMNEASREIRDLPTRLAREAELDTVKRDLEQAGKSLQDSVNAASKGLENDMKATSEGLEKDVKAAGAGMKAWTPPPQPSPAPPRPPVPPGPAPASPTPGGETAPTPPTESPFAEG
jgi:sec-independent protein translocase protein TatB